MKEDPEAFDPFYMLFLGGWEFGYKITSVYLCLCFKQKWILQ